MNSAPTDKPARDGTQERVTGPFNGFHVVSLGCFVGGPGAGFRGFYKICVSHPKSYWTAECMAQGRCGPGAPSGLAALRMAEAAAALHLQRICADAHKPDSHPDQPQPKAANERQQS